MDHCLAPDCQMGGLGCDNMTVVLVCFLRNKSYEELAKKCSRPVTNGTVDEDKKIDIDQKIDNEEAAIEKTENDETAEMDIT